MQYLFRQFVPEHYAITWDLTQIGARRVSGNIQIKGEQLNPDTIRLHAKDLTIESVYVNQTEIAELYTEMDELVIPHHGSGEVYVDIKFSLKVDDGMHGIYPCYYQLDGKRREVYATQFESNHAHEAFPCVDEPEAKATYDISLISNEPTVLSNMPIYKQTRDDDRVTTTFATTPRMSSYLVAFAAGDFQRATTKTSRGVEVNIYATKAHRPESLTWALEQAASTLEFFEKYFGIDYPLPKSDHIALPDFSAGAMENWGLVTYREIALLADPGDTTIEGKQYIAEVISHELSHQWFGNLVTMKWWDNLWLNESFASIMGYLAPSNLHPDWNFWFNFSTNESVSALRRDCIDSVQPVEIAVNHPDEINALFDPSIVYAKGGRLIRMLMAWIGEDTFRAGLTRYFTEYAYKNTVGDNLWDALTIASGKDVASLMHTWITQPGYPLVRVSLAEDTLTLQQEQFFVGPHTAADRLWPIPLDANHAELPELMTERSITLPFTSADALLVNQHDMGHYIALYDSGLRARIVANILAGKLTDMQRAQFLHEQTLLARGGYLESGALVDLLAAYGHETSEKVWGMMLIAINDLKRFVETDVEAEVRLRTFVGQLARPLYTKLGWQPLPGESEDNTKLRVAILSCMVYGEDQAVIDEAIKRAQSTDPEFIDPELRAVILSAAVRHGNNPKLIDTLLDVYVHTPSAELQGDITAALTSSRDPRVIARIITLLTDTRVIRQQDTVRWYVNLLRNREGRDATWRWMRTHWDWIDKTFSSDKSHDYFPRYSASLLSTRQQLEEYREFFAPHRENASLVRAIDIGMVDLEARVELIERDAVGVARALSQV